MDKYAELRELLHAMADSEGFNWMCRGNGWHIDAEDYRKLVMELLYAVEKVVGHPEDIWDEVLDNVPDYWFEEEDM